MSDYPSEHPYDPNRFPHFESPHPPPRLYDLMYAVSCDTRAKHYLIMIARDEFLLWWLDDARMIARVEEWRASVGLPKILNDVADFLDRVANRYGLSRRADLGRIPRPPNTQIEDLLPEWYCLQDRLYAAYNRAREVADAIERYVWDELQQPWPWLVGRLAFHVFQDAWERAIGITLIRQMASPLDAIYEPLVQPFHFVFGTTPTETVVEAKRRLMAEARDARKNIQPRHSNGWWDLPKKGSPRKDQQENTRQDARWLYRQLIHNDIPYQMAESHHDERRKLGKHTQGFSDACGCEQRVYRGLKNVQELLNATPYVFADTDK